MPKLLFHRYYNFIGLSLLAAVLLLLGILAWFTWQVALLGLCIFGVIGYYFVLAQQKLKEELAAYISTLSYRIKKAGDEVLSEFPIAVILYDEERKIEWHNSFCTELLASKESLIGQKLADVLPKLESLLEEETVETTLKHGEKVFQVSLRREERLIYLRDYTEFTRLEQKLRQEKNVFLFIQLDNVDEVSQGLDEQQRTLLISKVTRTLSQWAAETGIYLRRTSTDKFFGVMNEYALRQVEETRFDILDRVRELTQGNKLPVTLSIGVGAGADSLLELGEFAQSSLDLALGRGGDQAAVKRGNKITFYGGKTSAVEKRTRVRARVIAHALRETIRESDLVFIMGHQNPDLDSIGSAIGVLKAVEANGKRGFIILDRSHELSGINQLLTYIEEEPGLKQAFIEPGAALELVTPYSLLVLVDTHKPSMVISPKLLEAVSRRVVIDHHRRGEEFVADPLLVYLEPYASSTSELVTELLEYQGEQIKMNKLEATAMLAGIVVDTKSFTLRTGSRTFEAASYLRKQGAETVLVQKLLKEDLEQYKQRSRIVESATLYRDQFAIAQAQLEEPYGSILLAQAADTLLTMKNVIASFVVGQREDGLIIISARSLGDINVQVLMEKMNGGGHLTNAATQIRDMSLEDAVQWLKEVIDEHVEERGVKP